MDKEELLIAIGRNIKKLREAKGISQQELAAICNFEKSNMSRIESGRSNITIFTLQKIALATNTPLQEFVSFDAK